MSLQFSNFWKIFIKNFAIFSVFVLVSFFKFSDTWLNFWDLFLVFPGTVCFENNRVYIFRSSRWWEIVKRGVMLQIKCGKRWDVRRTDLLFRIFFKLLFGFIVYSIFFFCRSATLDSPAEVAVSVLSAKRPVKSVIGRPEDVSARHSPLEKDARNARRTAFLTTRWSAVKHVTVTLKGRWEKPVTWWPERASASKDSSEPSATSAALDITIFLFAWNASATRTGQIPTHAAMDDANVTRLRGTASASKPCGYFMLRHTTQFLVLKLWEGGINSFVLVARWIAHYSNWKSDRDLLENEIVACDLL